MPSRVPNYRYTPKSNQLVIESFFDLLKRELLYLQESRAAEYFKQELVGYPGYFVSR